jgi:hypothetical protein
MHTKFVHMDPSYIASADIRVLPLLQTVADMIVYNRSAEVRRSALATANRQSENIKLRLKLPYAAEGKLRELQELVKTSLEPPHRSSSSSSSPGSDASGSLDEDKTKDLNAASSSSSSGRPVSPSESSIPAAAVPQGVAAARRPGTPFGDAFRSLVKPKAGPARAASTRPSHPVVQDSVEVVVSRFTDAGLELLVKGKLRVEPTDSMVQALLLDLSRKVRQLGATMTTV